MACRGVLFAITEETEQALLAAESDDEVMGIVKSLEETWQEEHLAETDKAWDAIHRALTDGTLEPSRASFPLDRAILGGKQLHHGDDYIVALVPRSEVPTVARALAAIDDAAIRERYDRLVPPDYAAEHGEVDREYTAGYFRDVAELYARAARNGRAVIFTVDQ